uniref:Protein turtle n=1 Tax=Cacopsylla melanoneura TaxID=428564 RepID=A0A8D8SYH6_9HEMI
MGMWLNLAPFEINLHHISLQVLFIITLFQLKGVSPDINNAVHITALLGESVVFNCGVDFPGDTPVPYVLQWEKKGSDVPIYIWYDLYPPHVGAGYEERVSRVSPNSSYGKASLNLTNIRETDQGWYECKVVFLNRPPSSHTKNGTWFFLDVHAPPRFSVTPEEVIYVNLGDAIILNCQAEGTPTPEIVWYKDENIVDVSATTGVFNDGTELRISNIRSQDIGDYTCIARNGEGQISHSARVIIAGGAIIMVPPTNQTKLEGEKVSFPCEAKAMPGNVTVRWSKEGVPVKEVGSLETRVIIRTDGTLVINPVSSDDSGLYMCEVSNGIGDPQAAQAYLNVEFPAKVTFTPTVQYLPFRLQGVVQCHIKANPTLQYVTWTKDKRLLEPYQTKDIVVMQNGSLLFTRVNQNHQGRYTCTPYNAHGTQGSSGQMEVLVRKPPSFTSKPEAMYQRKVGESVDMHCDAQEADGTQKPTITWQRRDGVALPKNRVKISGGNITIEGLRRVDFGYYECVVSNEVATIVQAAQLVVEGTQPHAPYNITGIATEFSVNLEWLPGYSGGPDLKQNYVIWYREQGNKDWLPIPVTPPGSTQITINRLTPATTYEFQVVGKNELGDGMLSNIVVVKTKESLQEKPTKKPPQADDEHKFISSSDDDDVLDYRFISFPTDSTGVTLIPPVFRPKGPKPGPPRNVTVTEVGNGFVISWMSPLERANLIQYYLIKYRTGGNWKTLNKGQIRPEENSYFIKSLVGGRTYHFRVLAYSVGSFETSEEYKYPVPAIVKQRAITAGVVGGILFFIVAIILSVCFVKICNKRKRRRQEKAYNMVACRITDARNGGQLPGPCQVPLKKISGVEKAEYQV